MVIRVYAECYFTSNRVYAEIKHAHWLFQVTGLFLTNQRTAYSHPLDYESPPLIQSTRPGPDPIKILQHKFYAMQTF